jgi:hypothetical protein
MSIEIPLSNIQAHNKWYQSIKLATMVKGTQVSQLNEAMGIITLFRLRQTSTLEEYRSQFEPLSNTILKSFAEEFWVNMSVIGLKEEIRTLVKMLKPTPLLAAFGLAKLQEEYLRRNWI